MTLFFVFLTPTHKTVRPVKVALIRGESSMAGVKLGWGLWQRLELVKLGLGLTGRSRNRT